jgi:hypothetical protein
MGARQLKMQSGQARANQDAMVDGYTTNKRLDETVSGVCHFRKPLVSRSAREGVRVGVSRSTVLRASLTWPCSTTHRSQHVVR